MKSDLSSLTIVIPSFNRQSFLVRQFNYWRSINVHLIILDGSPLPVDSAHFFTNKFDNFDFNYFHLPVPLEERLGFVIDKIKTDFAALLSDDEFFLPHALQSCINYLSSNQDTVSCKGQALGFMWRHNKLLARNVYPELSRCCVSSSNPKHRLIQHFSPYQMISLWSVMRSSVFIKTLKAVAYTSKYETAAAAELQVSLITAYLGKCAVLDEIMWLRSSENANIWWDDGRLSFRDWYLDENLKDEHKRFFESIAYALDLPSTVFSSDLRLFRQALLHYCNNSSKRNTIRYYLKIVRAIYHKFLMTIGLPFGSWIEFDIYVSRLKKKGPIFSSEDLNRTKSIIVNFHALH